MTATGIYKIEGKKVTMAYVSPGSEINGSAAVIERPTSFDNPPSYAVLLTMERECALPLSFARGQVLTLST